MKTSVTPPLGAETLASAVYRKLRREIINARFPRGQKLRTQELCERYGPFSVLIMDIEGGELEVLETSGDVLKNFRLVIVELHEWTLGEKGVERCRDIFRQLGFQMAERSFITEVWLNPKVPV